MTTSLTIGENCSLSLGANTLLKTHLFVCFGDTFLSGAIHTVTVVSSGVMDGDGYIYHSFSRTGADAMSTIMPSVMQVNIDRELDGLYHRSFENGMVHIFDVLGPLAAFAMGVPCILLNPDIPTKDT